MRIRRLGVLAAATFLVAAAAPASADILIHVDKSAQRMTVSVDGTPRYVWPVSTGGPHYDTPSGTFKPNRMDKDHKSQEYDQAPMPYAMFFDDNGHAIHGTYEKSIGRAVSHGCVRLSVAHAATLWDLVKQEGMGKTKVVLDGHIPNGGALVASRGSAGQPMSIEPDQDDTTGSVPPANPYSRGYGNGNYYGAPPQYGNDPRYAAQPQYGDDDRYAAQQQDDDGPRYASRQRFQRVYRDDDDDDRSSSPFPFLFGR
jgi:hypothetical protein